MDGLHLADTYAFFLSTFLGVGGDFIKDTPIYL
jgi:hypothetical protein